MQKLLLVVCHDDDDDDNNNDNNNNDNNSQFLALKSGAKKCTVAYEEDKSNVHTGVYGCGKGAVNQSTSGTMAQWLARWALDRGSQDRGPVVTTVWRPYLPIV